MTDQDKQPVKQGTADKVVPLIRPPYWYGSVLVVALVLQLIVPVNIFSNIIIGIIIGALLIIFGFVLTIYAVRTLQRANVNPRFKPVGTIVANGPFAWTRNPIYLAFTLIYGGIGLMVNTAWPFIFLPIVLVVIHFGVIRREEKYLAARFGEEYQNYCSRVRRWL